MTLLPHKLVDSQGALPLHVLLLNFGKGLLHREAPNETGDALPGEGLGAAEILQYHTAESLERRVRDLTVKQLSTILRMQSAESEEMTMLSSLETLVLAGEIGYTEFVSRVQNLFPRAMAALEVTIRMKVSALVL